MGRYRLLIVLFLILFLITGCGTANEKVEKEITSFIEQQEQFIHEKKIDEYIATLSWKSPEYVAEKKSWMRDIQNKPIENLKLTVEKIEIAKPTTAYVTITQSYEFQGKKYIIQYPLVVKKEREGWKDSDLKFSDVDTAHFRILYFDSSKKYAEKIKAICEEAYENVRRRYGEEIDEKTVIKLYKDKEMLRQSVKLSFGWQFAGWYEYPESIKTTEFGEEEDYKEILEHELIHKLTIKKANNNLPYWFAEGLAMYFSNYENQPEGYGTKQFYRNVYGSGVLSIKELETLNLENMEEDTAISKYYDSSGMIVKYMMDTYGESHVKKIVEQLGTYDYLEGTGAEVDVLSIQRFHEVLPKVLKISVEELDEDWKRYIGE